MEVALHVEAAGGGPAVVLGHGFGGGAALRRQRARAGARPRARLVPAAGGGGFQALALDFADAIEREGLEAAGARFAWGPRSGLDARGAALVRQGFLEHPPHALAQILRELIATQPPLERLAAGLRDLGVPALVIAGAEDAPSVAASRTLAALLPDARLALVEGAGHVVNLARPKPFNAALGEFLASLPAVGQGA